MNKVTIICPSYDNLEYLSLFYDSYLKAKEEYNKTYNNKKSKNKENKNKESNKIDLIIGINGNDTKTEQFCINNHIQHTIQQKLGMYSAINLASRKVTDGFIIISNDDIYLDNYFFINLDIWLSNTIKNNQRAVLISKAIEPEPGSYTPYRNFGKTYEEFNITNFLQYCREIESHTSSFHNFGVVYAINHFDWFIINGFDERFDPYGGGMAGLMYRLFLSGIRNFQVLDDVLHYHFRAKCAEKHNKFTDIRSSDSISNTFKNKWKKNFEEIDNIMKKECFNNKNISIPFFNKSNKNTISTYISTYNPLFYQATLEQTIKQSLLFSDEIIIVNSEHSSDGTNELLDSIKSEYPNIIKLYNFKEDYSKHWDTVTEKKTFALKKCTKDYAILQDDDEVIHEKYINYIRQLPSLCPDTIAFRFNTIHFYRSYNHYQPPSDNWYKSKIYMVKNIPEIKHGKVNNDPDNFIISTQNKKLFNNVTNYINNQTTPLDSLPTPKVINTPVTVYHYGWALRNDAVLQFKKYIQEIQWWGNDYWKIAHDFPFKFENPDNLPIFNDTHPKYIQEIIDNQKYNDKWIKEFTK